MRLALQFAAPYTAVLLFWCLGANGWLAMFAYHALILLLMDSPRPTLRFVNPKLTILFTLGAALAGPLLYVLLPHMTAVSVSDWLAARHISPVSLLIALPYIGTVHPYLEQRLWAPLRAKHPLAHVAFAGYHLIVLATILTPIWVAMLALILISVSYAWRVMERTAGNLLPCITSHAVADIGILVAAWLRTTAPA